MYYIHPLPYAVNYGENAQVVCKAWQVLGWEIVDYNTMHSAIPEPDTVQFNSEGTML